MIVVVRADVLDPSLLGRVLDRELIAELEAAGVDACGENGEYHTLITDGPLFRAPILIATRERLLRSGCWFLDLEVLTDEPRSPDAQPELLIRTARAARPQGVSLASVPRPSPRGYAARLVTTVAGHPSAETI